MFRVFEESRGITKLIHTKYNVVFYAENRYYWQYFNHLIQNLQNQNLKICFITSDKNDPVLLSTTKNIDAYFSNKTLAFVFNRIQSDVMIMTMPDIGNYIFKRSATVKKYIYVFHAMVSIHQQYRSHAFDHYDTFFCVGPHHKMEVSEAVSLYHLPGKDLVDYGYPLLNGLEIQQQQGMQLPKKILIAPSWYEQGIFNACIGQIIKVLATSSYDVILRPHPEFIKRNKKLFKQIARTADRSENLELDFCPDVHYSLLSCDHLITDRSGIAFEFALGKGQPVIFIDTPLKIQNKHVNDFKNVPVENKFRNQIGLTLHPQNIIKLLSTITEAEQQRIFFAGQINEVRKQVLFENKLQNGIDYIMSQLS
jgi:YidC/Oxa1 family membrane protein insertase